MTDIIEKQIHDFVEKRRPPKDIRDQLDIGYTYDNGTFEIFEIRPQWNKPENILHHSVAKATYIKSQQYWKLYWKRANGSWEHYDPVSILPSITDVLHCIDNDVHGCFWG